MRSTNYFCNICFKTYTEFWQDNRSYLNRQGTALTPRNHPLMTGKCDNTDQSNHLVKGREICGGPLKVD